ncbi:MAG: tRNA uridine-5-carboxymethylaminomethyl(34) synthesis GTPase MnmE [Wolbachia endosymbiont of Tyrophagus putrescentiae]|nr:tRNA uridine-5-carboxymethylaminomethyl(34) synthesis GTPase MnmE [Wolbachia endosymbiont of Tyrophagus putrescentiae]
MVNTEKTIFALSTVFGKSGVAVIRISGSKALRVVSHFNINKKIKPRFATLVDLYDSSDQLIDNGIMIYFPAPNSFTGEDVVELQTHGSKVVIKTILEELSKIFVMAEPGEFSLRAFLNGKFDLTQIEGIADLIDAETKIQAKQAVEQISGALGRLYNNWRQMLINVQSRIEAYIDFPEDITTEQGELIKIDQEVQKLVKEMQNHLNDNRIGERLREGLHIVITGKPNAGKSTLFNYLAKRDIAIVSEYAGTTRDVLEAHIDIGGYPVILSDTAGIRDSLDPIESEGIKRAKKRSSEADIRIELYPFEQSDSLKCNTTDNDTIYVLSKADDAQINNTNLLPISVLKEVGIDKLISLLEEKIKEKFICDKEAPIITRQRHRDCILKALMHLQAFDISKPIELMSEDLRSAAVELGKIIGIIGVEEILDSIFNTFCIGK